MAEPTEILSKRMVEVFLEVYNEANGTNFKWIDGKSYQPKDKPYYDFVVFDGEKELGIQHSRAVSDPEREYVRPKAARKVIDPLQKLLEENLTLPNLLIYLNFHNPPKTDKEVQDAIYWLEFFISSKITSAFRPGYFNYEASFDGQILPRVLEYVNNIDIKPYPEETDQRIISIGYGWSKNEVEPWINDAQRILNAVEKKSQKAKDTLLLVESGWSGVHDAYLKTIKDELAKKDLKEVWIVELFLSAEKAYRVR